jgi:hypothetical protein
MWRYRFFLSIFALFFVYLLLHPQVQQSESASLLSIAQEILGGRALYSDILTSASPLALVVYVIPAALSRLLHLQACFLANLLALALEFASLMLVNKLLSASTGFRWGKFRCFIIGAAVSLVFYQVLFLKSLAEPYNLLAFLLLPYLLLSCGFPGRRNWALPVCALALLSVLLNPLCLFFLAYLELLWLFAFPRRFSWLSYRKDSLFLRVLVLLFVFALVGLPLYIALGMRELPLVFELEFSRFNLFNDALRYVLMSPDRRDLLYFWSFAFLLGLPFCRRLPVLHGVLALSVLGFFFYLCSLSLLTTASLLMVASSFLVCGFCFTYLWLKKFGLPVSLTRPFNNKFWAVFSYLLLLSMAIYLFVPGCFGKPILSDLSVFSEVLLAKTHKGDTVFCFSGQNRPAFPLLTQMERHCGYLAESSILLDLKRHRESLCPLGTDSLCQWQDAIHLKIKEELACDTRPSLLLVEDGDMKEYLKNAGIESVINDQYIACGYASLLNEDEMKQHEPFEYIGYRTGFSLYRRR